MKSVIYFLIKTNIWVSFCALFLALSSGLIFAESNVSISLFIFFSSLTSYNFQRLVRLTKATNYTHKKWFQKNKIVVSLLTFLAAILSICLFLNLRLNTKILIFILGVISIIYPFGIRKIPFVKIFLISFSWAVSAVLLLVFENQLLITWSVILQFLSYFFFVFAITIPFDIRDVDHDFSKVITIPIFFGVQQAKIISLLALFVCSIISFCQYFYFSLDFTKLITLFIIYFISSFYVLNSEKTNNEIYFSFWVESLSVVCYLLLLISELIF